MQSKCDTLLVSIARLEAHPVNKLHLGLPSTSSESLTIDYACADNNGLE